MADQPHSTATQATVWLVPLSLQDHHPLAVPNGSIWKGEYLGYKYSAHDQPEARHYRGIFCIKLLMKNFKV
jgi:hypothetical protein